MSEAVNPYSPPSSNVRMPEQPKSSGQLMAEPRAVGAGSSITWLVQGWRLVKEDFGIWVLMILAALGINIVLGFIPIIGSLASSLLSSVFLAGFFIAGRAAENGRSVEFTMLFEGFKTNFAPLVGISALSLALGAVGGFAIGIGMYFLIANLASIDPTQIEQLYSNTYFWGMVIIGAIYFAWVVMLLWFATPLVALNNVPVFKAMGMSQKACFYNILPLLLCSIMAIILFAIGALALLVGLLVVLPVLMGAYYKSYQQIFLK
ncbi:BPSS1780 family membrane protein [uncultured Thiothrix sp.]|uniref:BPSS1780 family membrane protein n=1 Tax=uncultured Thiothrix sp. TaxID=223185 RepID=UPI00263497B3|nr:BPSS1780 family membrane protein [uncultured Thiothrix sp.]